MDNQHVASPRASASSSEARPRVEDRAFAESVSVTAEAVEADAPTRIHRIEEAPCGVVAGSNGDSPAACDTTSGDRAPSREPSHEPSARTEAEAAAVPSEVPQEPTVSQTFEARAENPGSGASDPGHEFDPGRTMEGPGRAAKLGRDPFLDDATRIRSPVDESPQMPLSPSERTQVEDFLAGLGAGRPDEIGDAGRLMRSSGKLIRALTQGLVTVTMAKDRFDSELRGGISLPRPAPSIRSVSASTSRRRWHGCCGVPVGGTSTPPWPRVRRSTTSNSIRRP